MSRTLAAALALAEFYFPAKDTEGRAVVRIEDAHVLLSGQAAQVWPEWDHLPYDEQQRIGRLVAQRSRGEAELSSLQRRIRKGFDQQWEDPVVHRYLPGAREGWRMLEVYPQHGQHPLDSADRLLVPDQRQVNIEVAAGGGWQAMSPRGPVQLAFEDVNVVYNPPVLTTADATGPIPVDSNVLGWLTRAADEAMPPPAFREHQVGLLLSGTMGSGSELPRSAVLMDPGRMRHLSAPTGVGKNVFARAQAKQMARDGYTVALLVSDNTDVFDEVATLRRELKALNLKVSVTPLIAPGSRHEFTLQTAHKAVDEQTPLSQMSDELRERLSESGYGCSVEAQLDGRDGFGDGQEPCSSLRHTDPSRRGGPALCPAVNRCDKFSHIRAACSAQIIVTTHACFQRGMVKIPVLVDGVLRRQMSVRELLLRLAHLVIIDEVDAYQSRAFEASQSLVLASISDPNTALRKVRDNLHRAPASLRVESRGALTRAVWLAEQLLDLVSSGEICTETGQARALAAGQDPRRMRQILRDRRRWYQPHRWDRELLDNLIGVSGDASASAVEMDQLQALLPAVAAQREDRVTPAVLPQRLRAVPDLLERMLSLDESGQWELDTIKEELRTVVEEAVKQLADVRAHLRKEPCQPSPANAGDGDGSGAQQPPNLPVPVLAGGVFHAVMMKAWLSALNHTVFDLADRAGELAAHAIDGASTLADTVGHRDTGSVVPFGPLGQQISGFRFEGLDDPTAKPQLLMEVLRGDPHTETAFLGDMVSLALADHRRVVLGMSATGYLPRAARTHLLAEPQWAMPDAQLGGLSIFRSTPVVDSIMLAVGSTPYRERAERVAALARGYAPTLVKDLQRLAADVATAHRARALIAVNSYAQARLFAAALYEAALGLGQKLNIFVATPDRENPELSPVPDAITLVTRDQFSQLADRDGDVLISPLPRTERGLNILTMAPSGKRESAITLIGLAIRPVMPVDEPAALAASIAACAWRSMPRNSTPATRLAAIRRTARARLWTILAAPKRFTALPDDLRCELIATVLGQCIQLAGRGRRGQTHVELHLIDGAFHDTTWDADLPTLVRELYESYTPQELAGTGRTYGYTAEEFLEYAQAPHLLSGLRKGYPDHFGVAA